MNAIAEKESRVRPGLYLFAIFMLSVEWICFGSMHFPFHDLTKAQLPDCLRINVHGISVADHLVTVSGILEITAGIFVVFPALRTTGARLSLVALVLLSPAMYHIVYTPCAVDMPCAVEGPLWFRQAFQALIIPNNILLAIASIYLLSDPWVKSRESVSPARRSLVDYDRSIVLIGFILMACNTMGFIAIWLSTKTQTTACLWAMACLALGAVVGFLFGVPKINPSHQYQGLLQTNTNIDAISDWLTKIIVGVGLINFKEIGQFVKGIAESLASSLGPGGSGSDYSYALGLILYFFAAGVIEGYLITRMFLGPHFGRNSAGDTGAA